MSAQAFVELMVAEDVLRFGDFTLKSGRKSPYFFNLGNISAGSTLAALGEAYAQAIVANDLVCDLLFGPAYKGIPIATATAIALAKQGRDLPVAFNRKEVKAHGEGGQFVGAPVKGRVLIIDDVLTAGTAVREAVTLITNSGAEVAGVLIALDRREYVNDEPTTAAQQLQQQLGVPVHSIASLEDVIEYLDGDSGAIEDRARVAQAMAAYREQYCAA